MLAIKIPCNKIYRSPTEKVQLEAIKRTRLLYKHIENPSDKTQMAAIKTGSRCNQVYKRTYRKGTNGSDKEKSILNNLYKNPSEMVQMEVIERSPYLISEILFHVKQYK
jgi:hypothetical protein